ncbi:MAG: carbohydrate ABC transporter permease [Henriciella sp.]|nr:carbohydrate ABC transporter permease [Henriciella sp.]
MSLQTASHKWYVPFEILSLRSVLNAAVAMHVVLAALELIRDRIDLAGLTIALAAIFALLRWLAPQALSGSPRLQIVRLIVLLSIIIVARLTLAGDVSGYAVWARAWSWIPILMVLAALFSPYTSTWTRQPLSTDDLAEGLARNRRLYPWFQRFGSHVLLIHSCVLVLLPVIWIADVSISPGNLLGGGIGDAFSLEHYQTMLGGSSFWVWTRNSVIVAVGTTFFGLCLAVPSAYAFSRFDFFGRRSAMFAFIVVQMFPGAIILVPYFLVMKTLGLLNTSIGLIVAYSVTALPLCIWMLKGFFDAVPRELEEAAKLDGCSTAQIFLRIILPLSIPAVAVTGIFSFLTAWNEFLLALVFNTSNDQFTLPVGLASLIPTDGQRWGDFAAASLLVSIPVVILFILFQRSLIQGLSSGAVKG